MAENQVKVMTPLKKEDFCISHLRTSKPFTFLESWENTGQERYHFNRKFWVSKFYAWTWPNLGREPFWLCWHGPSPKKKSVATPLVCAHTHIWLCINKRMCISSWCSLKWHQAPSLGLGTTCWLGVVVGWLRITHHIQSGPSREPLGAVPSPKPTSKLISSQHCWQSNSTSKLTYWAPGTTVRKFLHFLELRNFVLWNFWL